MMSERPRIKPKESTAEERQLSTANMSLNEKVIARAMILGAGDNRTANTFTTSYRIDAKGMRILDTALSAKDAANLLRQFERDPQKMQAIARNNLIAISRDPRTAEAERKNRLSGYIDAYAELIVKMDRAVFQETPDGSPARQGIPAYIPDGLSDMGSDRTIDPGARSREKLRVNKREMYQKMKHLLADAITAIGQSKLSPDNSGDLEKIKRYFIEYIAAIIPREITYDYENKAQYEKMGRSVKMSDVQERRLGQCRHQALYGQVLMQFLGITSRLFKCDMDYGKGFEAHVANLVRINGKNHILDITNPDPQPGGKESHLFLREIPDANIDAVPSGKKWFFTLKNGEPRSYRKRDNMYYRIRRN